ncbi:hypothetical protein JXA02_10280 [candidate division KSB1 bacterium]|nr:hypothetical protein [candidate division KSB1 bacterium]
MRRKTTLFILGLALFSAVATAQPNWRAPQDSDEMIHLADIRMRDVVHSAQT